jgi:16S rRNA (guanine1516-N2)-methyltransferase
MYPHRKKSAQVKKEMRIFQQLVGADADADKLLQQALQIATRRVVVKRPSSAAPLAGKAAANQLNTKTHRFDIYSLI